MDLYIVYHTRDTVAGSFVYGVFDTFKEALDVLNEIIILGYKERPVTFEENISEIVYHTNDQTTLFIKNVELNKNYF